MTLSSETEKNMVINDEVRKGDEKEEVSKFGSADSEIIPEEFNLLNGEVDCELIIPISQMPKIPGKDGNKNPIKIYTEVQAREFIGRQKCNNWLKSSRVL